LVCWKLDEFAPNARILHVEVDAAEIAKLRAVDVALHGDLNEQLKVFEELEPQAIAAWQQDCQVMKKEFAWRYDYPGKDIYAPLVLNRLTERAGDDLTVTCDVGQHQMWVAQHCDFVPVVVVSGDGSIMMNIQELATLKRYDLPVKILLFDNSALGLVRQWQDLFFDGRQSEVDLSDNPDFCKVAESFGVTAKRITQADEIEEGLDFLLNTKEACLLHVIIDKQANVWPLVPQGKSNSTMLDEGYE